MAVERVGTTHLLDILERVAEGGVQIAPVVSPNPSQRIEDLNSLRVEDSKKSEPRATRRPPEPPPRRS